LDDWGCDECLIVEVILVGKLLPTAHFIGLLQWRLLQPGGDALLPVNTPPPPALCPCTHPMRLTLLLLLLLLMLLLLLLLLVPLGGQGCQGGSSG
jgi:hypothetical protein